MLVMFTLVFGAKNTTTPTLPMEPAHRRGSYIDEYSYSILPTSNGINSYYSLQTRSKYG